MAFKGEIPRHANVQRRPVYARNFLYHFRLLIDAKKRIVTDAPMHTVEAPIFVHKMAAIIASDLCRIPKYLPQGLLFFEFHFQARFLASNVTNTFLSSGKNDPTKLTSESSQNDVAKRMEYKLESRKSLN